MSVALAVAIVLLVAWFAYLLVTELNRRSRP